MKEKIIRVLMYIFTPKKYGMKYHPCIKCKWCELDKNVSPYYFESLPPESKIYFYYCQVPLKQVRKDMLTGCTLKYNKPVNESICTFRIATNSEDCGYRGKYWEAKSAE